MKTEGTNTVTIDATRMIIVILIRISNIPIQHKIAVNKIKEKTIKSPLATLSFISASFFFRISSITKAPFSYRHPLFQVSYAGNWKIMIRSRGSLPSNRSSHTISS